jgi:hypothetical protein
VERAEFDADQARLGAWRTLIGRIDELYPDAKPQRDIIKLRLIGDGEGGKGKPTSFFAVHQNSERLTNVTLAIETVHALTSPSPTAIQYYYIPRWPPGQRIYLPATCAPNVMSRELMENSGMIAPRGLEGMVEARAQLWSDKISQPSQATSFDANFQPIARAQLNEAYRMIDEALRRPASLRSTTATSTQPAQRSPAGSARPAVALVPGPIIPLRADLAEDDPDLQRARSIARRARGLLPPQSSLADNARDLAAQPVAALRDLRKRQVDAFVEAMTLRAPRAGGWVIHQPAVLAKLAKPAERDAVVSAAGAKGGRVTLTIDSRTNDGASVAATLTSSDQPDLKRKFTGRLQLDASANRLLLNLRSTQPPPGRPPVDADLKKVVHWTSLLLELRNNQLVGIATAGPSDDTVMNVAFGAAQAVPAAPAAPGAARSRPRPTTAKAK